jgi:hypothetical protein
MNTTTAKSLGTAPAFKLDAIGTTRKVSLQEFAGKPVILVFNNAESAEQADKLNNAIRAQYRDYRTLPIITVVDLHSVPKLFRSVARSSMQKSFTQAATAARSEMQAGGMQTPDDMSHVVTILPDWDGSVTKQYGIGDVTKSAAMVLIDAQGEIIVRGWGETTVPEVLAALAAAK